MRLLGKLVVLLLIILPFLAFPAQAVAATLSLSPASGTFNRSCDFTFSIELDTAGAQTDGTDAIIKYDPARVTALRIKDGTIYSDYPGSNIDTASGKITISGLASVQQGFSGKGSLATVDFRVLDNAPTGVTLITFDFDPNDKSKTTDSNVVERGTVVDVLSSVVNGNYTIGTGSCLTQSPSFGTGTTGTGTGRGATGISTPSAGQPGTIDQIVGGKPGTPELTYTLAIVGMILTVLGILGLALL